MQKSKVVIDTNILISAFVFGGNIEKVIKKVFSLCEIYVSPELLREYREVPLELKRRGKINLHQLEVLISGIAGFVSKVKFVNSKERLFICRDKEDNLLLECCLAAEADFLITGDKDLLAIEPSKLPPNLRNLKIITPLQLLQLSLK